MRTQFRLFYTCVSGCNGLLAFGKDGSLIGDVNGG